MLTRNSPISPFLVTKEGLRVMQSEARVKRG